MFAHLVTPTCPYPVGDQQSRHENHLSVGGPGVRADCMGLTNRVEVGNIGKWLLVTLTPARRPIV